MKDFFKRRPIRAFGKKWSRTFILSALAMLLILTILDSTVFQGMKQRQYVDQAVIVVFFIGWIIAYYIKPEWFKD